MESPFFRCLTCLPRPIILLLLIACSGGFVFAQPGEGGSFSSDPRSSGQRSDSSDTFFSLDIGGLIQGRYVANVRDEAIEDPNAGNEEIGFQLRRARIKFSGHIGMPEIPYSLRLAGSRGSGIVGVELATAGYRFSDALAVYAGRFKAALLREESISSSRQLTAERSLVNAVFTTSYVEGVTLFAQPIDRLRLQGSINDGLRSGDVGGVSNDFPNGTADVAFSGRVDARIAGAWDQMSDYSDWSDEGTGFFVGGGVHYEKTKNRISEETGTGDFLVYSADALFKASGFGAFAALVGRRVDLPEGEEVRSLSDLGIVAQAGYQAIPDRLEPFVRYEWIDPDEERGFEDMNLITLGANAYIVRHRAKVTLDVVWALNELNPFAFTKTPSAPTGEASRNGLGLLPDTPGSDGQVAVRAQLQVKL